MLTRKTNLGKLKSNKLVTGIGSFYTKNETKIKVTAGVIGLTAAGVIACINTLKLENTIDECKEDIDNVKSKEDYSKRDLAGAYLKSGAKVGKLYSIPVALASASIFLILSATKKLEKKNADLAAAYSALNAAYNAYRNKVIAKLGPEEEKKLRYDIENRHVEWEDEDGKHSQDIQVYGKGTGILDVSPYARFFDESCPDWCESPDANLTTIKLIQADMNKKLKLKGYLFLNEVYEALGIMPTEAGQHVGWLYETEDGDSEVDFGIYDRAFKESATRRFVQGYEPVILLDFNCQGRIDNLLWTLPDSKKKLCRPICDM